MKAKFTLILTLTLLITTNLILAINVKAEGYSEGTPGIGSVSCGSDTCFSLGTEYFNNETATFGIRAQLVDKNNKAKSRALNIWATEGMHKRITQVAAKSTKLYSVEDASFSDSKFLYNYGNGGLRSISDSKYTYSNYINDMNSETVIKIINLLMKTNYTKDNIPNEYFNYYIKIEPIYLEILKSGGKYYPMAGTSLEILEYAYYNFNPSGANYSQGGIPVVRYLLEDQVNTAKNYILTTYITKDTKPLGTNFKTASTYTGTNKEIINLYVCGSKNYCSDKSKRTGDNGLGVGYVTISNKIDKPCSGCSCDFDKLSNKNDMNARISLYRKYKDKGEDYNQLLNLNMQTSSTACQYKSCNNETCSGCLSSSVGYNTEFNSRNLSCYNEIRDGLYCFNSFELSNSLNSNIFSINQGGVLLKNVSITGALTTSCYGGYANSTFRYRDYIKELKIENAPNSKKLSTGDIIRSTSFKDNLFTTKLTTNYNLPSVYASILSGKASYEDCDNCRFLGYGIITKFIEENGTFNGTFSSKLKIDNKKFNVNADTLKGDCTYYSTPELIDNGGLNLEFRIIDTGNPFPGKSGSNNRKVGLNWCDEDNCTQDNNTLITKYIKDANNSYNKNKEAQPKYKITLSSSDIKVIKEYNKKAEAYGGYDDNTLNCNDENNCSSTFIEGLKSGILKYYVDGNRNSEEYIGNMLNRLIINK